LSFQQLTTAVEPLADFAYVIEAPAAERLDYTHVLVKFGDYRDDNIGLAAFTALLSSSARPRLEFMITLFAAHAWLRGR
jgi:hypothetical protein